MTKDEAITAMKDGKKITHTYFFDNESVRMENGKIITEEGYASTPLEFWRWRIADYWKDGYEIKE